jgi:hypothetical protein
MHRDSCWHTNILIVGWPFHSHVLRYESRGSHHRTIKRSAPAQLWKNYFMYLPKGRKVSEIRANTCVRWIPPKYYPLLPYCSTPPAPLPAPRRARVPVSDVLPPADAPPWSAAPHQDGWRASPTLPPSPAAGVEAEEEREKIIHNKML